MTPRQNSSSRPRPAPELLAPAGNWECAKAAVENGANAIYFGLQVGFNARARAANFAIDDLPDLMAMLHQRQVKGYVTLNTLVFTDELPALEEPIRRLATEGVDAVLVQDLGVARLIRRICPQLPVHASTQMTMTCAESIQVARQLGLARVVLARELSIREIQKITAATDLPVETFVHGALCVAYSGQCLTSESLGGRSANRGQCAQACRLNYELIVDGRKRELGDVQYLLSPQDLAALALVPDLMAAGVCSLKIEGRLKSPEYVANIVRHYRSAIDDAMANVPHPWTGNDRREMELSFSRGFSTGWLEGCDHKRLVPGRSSAKRGVQVGHVVRLRGERLEVELQLPLAKGDGIVLEGNRAANEEIGGRVYEVLRHGRPVDTPTSGRVELRMQRGLLRNAQCQEGQPIFQTDDPRLTKKLRATFDSPTPLRRVPIDLHVQAHVQQPLWIQVQVETVDSHSDQLVSQSHWLAVSETLSAAHKHPIDAQTLREQLGRLGGSAYVLRELTAEISGDPMVPLSVLGQARKQIIHWLDLQARKPPSRELDSEGTATRMLSEVKLTRAAKPVGSGANAEQDQGAGPDDSASARLWVLVRSMRQLEQVLSHGVPWIYADFHDIREYGPAVEKAHAHGARIYLASLRIHKPGERGLFLATARHGADGWLVRNLAAVAFCQEQAIPMIGDFSLNVTNPLTAQWLMRLGLERCTASYDLNRDQLLELVQAVPGSWLEVVVHQHMPMFHMEHCVFCSVLSPGTNHTNCGRPCDTHQVSLRDRVGVEHTLHADVGCRNTLYNGIAQSGAEAVAPLLQGGVRQFRVELLRDCPQSDIDRLLEQYASLIAGQVDGTSVWRNLKAHNRVGVTRGTLEQPRNPLAVL
jgi:putative protease